MVARRTYPTGRTDAAWELHAPLIPAAKPGGRPAIHERRKIVDARVYQELFRVRI
jgi:transposase